MISKIALIFVSSILLVACGNADEIVEVDNGLPKAELTSDWSMFDRSANTQIQKVWITADKMTLEVSYSGGCEEHKFMLYGDQNIMKSLPPQRGIRLFHDSNGDSCRELVTETLVFDVTAFRYPSGPIHLLLDGWDDIVIYN